jgi:hypothetical protein
MHKQSKYIIFCQLWIRITFSMVHLFQYGFLQIIGKRIAKLLKHQSVRFREVTFGPIIVWWPTVQQLHTYPYWWTSSNKFLSLLGDIQQLHTYPCWETSSNYVPTLTGGHPRTNYLPLLGDIQQINTYPYWWTSSN